MKSPRTNITCAKSYVGQTVNVHMRDGSVLVGVRFHSMEKIATHAYRAIFAVAGHADLAVHLMEIAYFEPLALEAFLQ